MNKLFSPTTKMLPSPTMVTFKIDSAMLFKEVDGSTVMLESRVFNESPLSSKKCCLSLTKLFYLCYRGGTLSETEATNIFFSITKAFQSKDQYLRRLVYLAIKELTGIAKDVIIVTSSLTQDISSKAEAIYRANAIRTLCKITDSTLIQGIERFMKQSLLDSQSVIASAALVSCIHLFGANREIVRRWVSVDISSPSGMGRTHALTLLFLLRQNDRVATLKLLQKYQSDLSSSAYGSGPSHPSAVCYLLRMYLKLASEDPNMGGLPEVSWKSLLNFSSNKEMVAYEAAKTLCELPSAAPFELVSAVAVLQAFLGSSKPLLRFAAIRTLNRLASSRPDLVATCNMDMESLITDANRSIATLAITTLLKTGNDASVDRLMSQIKNYMPEISDELKVSIVDAVGALCLKFPAKHAGMLNFLGWRLRDEGSVAYKRAIVASISDIVQSIPEAKDSALDILCEFVEDCEYVDVAADVLYFLARECPSMSNPMKYIRHIYNRLLLEVPPVRLAAVGALIQFGTQIPSLRPTIKRLLSKCLLDEEDDIRDRALSFINSVERPELLSLCYDRVLFSLNDLEAQIVDYLSDAHHFSKPLDTTGIPVVSIDSYLKRSSARGASGKMDMRNGPHGPSGAASAAGRSPLASPFSQSLSSASVGREGLSPTATGSMAWLESFPELAAALGPLFHSSARVELTEPETEYGVSCVKHVFQHHVVLQYVCRNTMTDLVLENVSVKLDGAPLACLTHVQTMPISRLAFDSSTDTSVLSVFAFDASSVAALPLGTLSNTLHFRVKEIDSTTGDEEPGPGSLDEYSLQPLDLLLSDYVAPVWKAFDAEWAALGERAEAKQVFQLSGSKSLAAAVGQLKAIFGGAVCNESDVVPTGASSHTLILSGVFLGGAPLLVRCRFAALAGSGLAVELAARCPDPTVGALVVSAM